MLCQIVFHLSKIRLLLQTSNISPEQQNRHKPHPVERINFHGDKPAQMLPPAIPCLHSSHRHRPLWKHRQHRHSNMPAVHTRALQQQLIPVLSGPAAAAPHLPPLRSLPWDTHYTPHLLHAHRNCCQAMDSVSPPSVEAAGQKQQKRSKRILGCGQGNGRSRQTSSAGIKQLLHTAIPRQRSL